MKRLLIVLSLFLCFACTPQQRLNRLLKKHPELVIQQTIVKIDTIVFPSYNFDTILKITTKTDTFYIDKDRLKIQIIKKDSNIFINSFLPADTIFKTDTIHKTEIKLIKEDHFLQWLKWIFSSLSVIAVIIFLLRKFA